MVVELNRPALICHQYKIILFFHCKTLIKVEPPQVGKELAAANIGEEHVEEALVLAAPGEVDQEWVVDFLKERTLGSFQKV